MLCFNASDNQILVCDWLCFCHTDTRHTDCRITVFYIVHEFTFKGKTWSHLTDSLFENRSEVPLGKDWWMLVQTHASLSGPSQCPTPEKHTEREKERVGFEL